MKEPSCDFLFAFFCPKNTLTSAVKGPEVSAALWRRLF